LSETICSIRTKFWWNSHWMVLFQNCVWQSHSLTKMATTVQLLLLKAVLIQVSDYRLLGVSGVWFMISISNCFCFCRNTSWGQRGDNSPNIISLTLQLWHTTCLQNSSIRIPAPQPGYGQNQGGDNHLILYHLLYNCDTQLVYKIPQSEYLLHNQGMDKTKGPRWR
jgi:hypothetical protein